MIWKNWTIGAPRNKRTIENVSMSSFMLLGALSFYNFVKKYVLVTLKFEIKNAKLKPKVINC